MQANGIRNIRSGKLYDHYFPKSIGQDTVIKKAGQAKLHHTINLIKEIVHETLSDTEKIALQLKGGNLYSTCQNIWEFVYNHVRYKPDKRGVEQVRRPSRVWKDRFEGCDCDCMTTMISSILTNLSIPHKIRITKYLQKDPLMTPRYQHIYPVVPFKGGYITMDCVTDWFNYEVPYLSCKDFLMSDRGYVGSIEGLSIGGVDSLALRETVKAATQGNSSHPKRIRSVRGKVKVQIKNEQLIFFNQGEEEVRKEPITELNERSCAGITSSKNKDASFYMALKKWGIAFGVGVGVFYIVNYLRK